MIMKKKELLRILCKTCSFKEKEPHKYTGNFWNYSYRHSFYDIDRKFVLKTAMYDGNLLTAGSHYFCKPCQEQLGPILKKSNHVHYRHLKAE